MNIKTIAMTAFIATNFIAGCGIQTAQSSGEQQRPIRVSAKVAEMLKKHQENIERMKAITHELKIANDAHDKRRNQGGGVQ